MNEQVNVPLEVTGEFVTPQKVAGIDRPTLVTVPEPTGVAHVPSPRQKLEPEAPDPLLRFVTGRFPVTPPAPDADRLIAGKSAPTICLTLAIPVLPFGVPTKLFAASPVVGLHVITPEVVTGPPLHVNQLAVVVTSTLCTVPEPTALWQAPSAPRYCVPEQPENRATT